MSAREKAISTILGTASVAVWLAGASMPAFANGQAKADPFMASFGTVPEVTVEAPVAPAPGEEAGAAFVAGAGLKQYAMTNDQLGNVRGGFYTNGVQLSFGFQQFTTVDGTMVQSILVPVTAITNGVTLPVYVTGQTSWTTTATETAGTTTPGVTVTTTGNNGQTAIQTALSGGSVVSSISNTANNQLIDRATTENIDLNGLSASVAAAQAVNNVLNAVNRAGLIR